MVNYLIGCLVRNSSTPARFEPFFAPTFKDEEKVVREFFDWASNLNDPVFYHWHHYERTHLTNYYGLPEDHVAWVMDRQPHHHQFLRIPVLWARVKRHR